MVDDNKATSSNFRFSVEGMPNCCGAAEVGGFAAPPETGSYYNKTLKKIDWTDLQPPFFAAMKAKFDSLISDYYRDDSDDDNEEGGRYGVLIATTTPYPGNHHQNIATDILEKTGWFLVSKNINPNTGNTIHTWIYNRKTDKKD